LHFDLTKKEEEEEETPLTRRIHARKTRQMFFLLFPSSLLKVE